MMLSVAEGCTFCARGPSAGATATFDLGGLTSTTFALRGELRNGSTTTESYLVSNPCVLAASASCGPVDGPMAQGCRPVGHLEPAGPNATVVARTPTGFNITLRGGFDVPAMKNGRNAVFEFVCAAGAAPDAGPEPGVVESPAGFYRVTWKTAAACTPARGHGTCAPPPPPPAPPPPPGPSPPGAGVCRPAGTPTWNMSSSTVLCKGLAPLFRWTPRRSCSPMDNVSPVFLWFCRRARVR